MQGLQLRYIGYFNRKYNKVGHLFQGRYKAILCDRDTYLLELVRYLHLNPERMRAPMQAAVARDCKVAENHLTGKHTGHRDERGIALELMYCYAGVTQARIGELVGLDYTAVSRERKRLRERIETDKRLKGKLEKIAAAVLS